MKHVNFQLVNPECNDVTKFGTDENFDPNEYVSAIKTELGVIRTKSLAQCGWKPSNYEEWKKIDEEKAKIREQNRLDRLKEKEKFIFKNKMRSGDIEVTKSKIILNEIKDDLHKKLLEDYNKPINMLKRFLATVFELELKGDSFKNYSLCILKEKHDKKP